MGLLNLLECCRHHGTKRVLYVSSGGVVYGEPDVIPTPETFPKLPLSPYGVTKLTGEYYLNYYRVMHGLEYVALRYSNVYGPRQDPHGEAGVVAIFSTRLLRKEGLTIFGEGDARPGTTSSWGTWWRRICWPRRWNWRMRRAWTPGRSTWGPGSPPA
jgi:UDP-glucose 4-epimerase